MFLIFRKKLFQIKQYSNQTIVIKMEFEDLCKTEIKTEALTEEIPEDPLILDEKGKISSILSILSVFYESYVLYLLDA